MCPINLKYTSVALVILFSLTIIPSSALTVANYPISTSGIITYPNNPFPIPTPNGENQVKMLRYVWAGSYYTKTSAQYAASVDILETFYPGFVSVDVKNYNPNVKILLYFDMPFTLSAFAQTFINNNWIIRDSNNNYITRQGGDYVWDIGNSNARTYVANWLNTQLTAHSTIDGIRFDDCGFDLQYFYYISVTAINPRTGNSWTNQEICDATTAFLNLVKTTTNKLVFINGIANGWHFWDTSRHPYFLQGFANANFDGVMSEAMFSMAWSPDNLNWVTEDYWRQSLDTLAWLENNWMTDGTKYRITIAENAQHDWSGLPTTLPNGVTQEQYMTFCFASNLLSIKYGYPFMCATAYTFSDFYQSLFKIDIGNPTESYHTIENSHVYGRTFSAGRVLVNPTGNSYTVTIGAGYKNAIDGTVMASTVTVPPHTGIILKS